MLERRPHPEEIEKFSLTPEQWGEGLKYYHEHKLPLIQAAAFARRTATSHRNPPFEVGAAVMTIEPNLPEGEYGVYQAHNVTPTPGKRTGFDKRCAERNALDAAQGWSKVAIAITTISKETHTGDPTQAHDTLHPCAECRIMFRELLKKGFLREDTIICNANDDGKELVTEERSLKDLLALYEDEDTK